MLFWILPGLLESASLGQGARHAGDNEIPQMEGKGFKKTSAFKKEGRHRSISPCQSSGSPETQYPLIKEYTLADMVPSMT